MIPSIVWMRLVAAAAVLLGLPQQTDLDAFMAKVLERREVNRRTLNDYILSEVETFELLGPGRVPMYRFKREYAWYVREGLHVRSPVKADGVTISEEERRKYEEDWFRREQRRLKRVEERRAKGQAAAGEEAPVPSGGVPAEGPGVGQVLEPRFVSEAYFLDFKFEPGNYYLVGKETLDNHEVLRVEYYPTKMFADEPKPDEPDRELTIGVGSTPQEEKPQEPKKPPKPKREPSQKEKDFDAEINRKMNKTSLVTLWIDPAEHQIVKYIFDNVWMDFLPARWLVRVDDIKASMTMGQPFQGVWLPEAITIHAGVTLAQGSFEASYARTFSDFREADVTSKIKVKGQNR